jgi:hypothetical protein
MVLSLSWHDFMLEKTVGERIGDAERDHRQPFAPLSGRAKLAAENNAIREPVFPSPRLSGEKE